MVAHAWGIRPASVPILLACIAVPGVFWLFARALFEDDFGLRAWHAAPLVALLALGMADAFLRLSDTSPADMLAPTVTVASKLPAGLHGGPITYRIDGTQYLVVAPGGHAGLPSTLGGWVIAYALRD